MIVGVVAKDVEVESVFRGGNEDWGIEYHDGGGLKGM